MLLVFTWHDFLLKGIFEQAWIRILLKQVILASKRLPVFIKSWALQQLGNIFNVLAIWLNLYPCYLQKIIRLLEQIDSINMFALMFSKISKK